jgi:hypothetical protein
VGTGGVRDRSGLQAVNEQIHIVRVNSMILESGRYQGHASLEIGNQGGSEILEAGEGIQEAGAESSYAVVTNSGQTNLLSDPGQIRHQGAQKPN